MTEAQRHPIDFDALEKGSYISPETVTHAMGVKPDDYRNYRFAIMSLKAQIEHALADRGHAWTVKCERDGLRVLRDPEAATHNRARFDQGQRVTVKAHILNLAVDQENLTDEERIEHERSLRIQGAKLLAQTEAGRLARLEERRRKALTGEVVT